MRHLVGLLSLFICNSSSLSRFKEMNPETKVETEIDVATYFQKKYKMKLKYPGLPCIEVGSTKLKLPIEVCRLARAVPYTRDLNAEQRTIMLDNTRLVWEM